MFATAAWTFSSVGELVFSAAAFAACFFQFLIARIRGPDAYRWRHAAPGFINGGSEYRERIPMALFRTSPEKSVIKDRDTAKANRDRLAAKLHEAEANVIATKSAAQRAALAGDDGTLDAAEAAEGAALRRHGTIVVAHAKAEEVLALLEGQVDATLDAKVRAATAAAIEAIADEIEKSGESFAIGAAALAEAAKHAALVTPDAAGLANFASNVMVELPPSIVMTAEMLRAHAAAVLSGAALAAMPTPEPIVKPVKLVQAATSRVFSTKQVTWSTPDGMRFAPKYVVLDLPPDVATRALKLGACSAVPGEAWRAYKGTHAAFNDFADTVNLDEPDEAAKADGAAKPLAEPLVHSAFKVVNRGPAYQLRVAGGTS
jgi:hypothetical protein